MQVVVVALQLFTAPDVGVAVAVYVIGDPPESTPAANASHLTARAELAGVAKIVVGSIDAGLVVGLTAAVVAAGPTPELFIAAILKIYEDPASRSLSTV